MRIRQLVRKVNKSLGQNSNEWTQLYSSEIILRNSRGISLSFDCIGVKDKWNDIYHFFNLNDKEVAYLNCNFYKNIRQVSEEKIGRFQKRRGWIVREILKTL